MAELGGESIDVANPDAKGKLTQSSNAYSTITTSSRPKYAFVSVYHSSCPLFMIDCENETITYIENGTKMTATWGPYVTNVTDTSVDFNFYRYMGGSATFSYVIYT